MLARLPIGGRRAARRTPLTPMSTARDRPPEEAAEDTSFARGLRVLLTVADRGEVRADELSTLLDTPISTVYRYLRTLASFGFVDRHGAGYRLGPRLIIGGGAVVTSEELIRVAIPVLEMLVEETGETAVIFRRIGSSAVCLHEVQSHHALRVAMEPGSSWPLHRGAPAKVLLAFAPEEMVDEVVGEGDGDPAEPAIDPGALRADLETIRSSGIGRTEGELFSGSVAIAVPILREDGIVAAIGVVGPAQRCGLAWRTRVSRLLMDAASVVGGSLGG
jgi:DNA-binding IclR family transcriptional regulator